MSYLFFVQARETEKVESETEVVAVDSTSTE